MNGRMGSIVASTLVCLVPLAAGCVNPPRLVRHNPLVRALFYPPTVEKARELTPADDTRGAAMSHAAFARVLGACVDERGGVDYAALRRKPADLNATLYALETVEPDLLSRFERLALFINAYNAFTLQLIIEHPGLGSIRDIPAGKCWKAKRWRLGGRTFSLLQIEHDLIRRQFGEPRVHFALVCASRGCPKLRWEPYVGARLLDQLDDQARDFFSRRTNFRYDFEDRVVWVSELLDWYRADFGKNTAALAACALRYADAEVRREAGRHSLPPRVKYLPYDWRLNGTWQR